MNKKHFYAVVILLLFLVIGIQPALATKYIRNDETGGDAASIGNWDWPTKTCTLTQNVYETIQIVDDGITLDGLDPDEVTHTVTGSGSGTGISLPGRTNVTIKNVKVTGFGAGISLAVSNGCTVTGNTVSTCHYGIWLAGSSNNEVTNNTVNSSSEAGIWLQEGLQDPLWVGSDNNTLTSNNITGVSDTQGNGIYIQDCSDNTLTSNSVSDNKYGIKLSSCDNISIGSQTTTNNISENYWGIHVYNSNSNELTNNSVSDNAGGIWLDTTCNDNNLTNNTVLRNGPGIYLRYSSNNNTLTDNTASNNDNGIKLLDSSSNTLTGNTASNNEYGIKLENSSNNTLTNNAVSGNTLFGIWLDPSNNNQIYNNNFIGTAPAILAWIDTASTGNVFYMEPPIGGNFWSDWDETGSYTFDVDGEDKYPWATQDGWLDPTPPIIITVNIEEAKVSWDHSDIHVDGKLYLPQGFWMDNLIPVGSAVITLAEVGVADQIVGFEIAGKKDDKWEYKDKENLNGPIKEFKIDWKGAKFDYKGDDKFHIHTHFISGTETTLCIHTGDVSGAFTVSVNETTIAYDEDRIITTVVDYESQKDDNTHVHFTLPFQLSPSGFT